MSEPIEAEYVELTPEDVAFRYRERTLRESVDEAIAASDIDEYVTPESALRWLLTLAWSDLQTARHTAINGRWSIACDSHVNRIIGLTSLVGPISWEEIQVDLILDGIYEQIHGAIGTPTPLTNDEHLQAQWIKDRRLG